jgi:glycine betaine/proline transport system ATP-binding protein
MDEAFSALDPLIRAGLQTEVLALQAETGRTIVFVTHDLDEALRLGHRLAILHEGRVLQVGTPDELQIHLR